MNSIDIATKGSLLAFPVPQAKIQVHYSSTGALSTRGAICSHKCGMNPIVCIKNSFRNGKH